MTDLDPKRLASLSGTLVARKPPVGGYRSPDVLVELRGLEPLTPTLPGT
jgi:hypothetical protein